LNGSANALTNIKSFGRAVVGNKIKIQPIRPETPHDLGQARAYAAAMKILRSLTIADYQVRCIDRGFVVSMRQESGMAKLFHYP
jgi:hypothetical protein